jgi:hypothetical protein
MQASLGELNDIHMARSIAERLAGEADDPKAAFAGGLAAGVRACRSAGLLKTAQAAYDRVLEAERFW